MDSEAPALNYPASFDIPRKAVAESSEVMEARERPCVVRAYADAGRQTLRPGPAKLSEFISCYHDPDTGVSIYGYRRPQTVPHSLA